MISPTAADGSRIFLQAGNLTDILRQVSLIGIISLAMTFVILTGGIDLSVGSILALSTSLVAMMFTRRVAAGLRASHSAGDPGRGGGLRAGRRAERRGDRAAGIQPFIVTLATMIGMRGLAKWLTGNENIDIGFGQDLAAAVRRLCSARRRSSSARTRRSRRLFWVVLARTVFGRHVRAIGDNEKAGAVRRPADPARPRSGSTRCPGLLSGFAGVLYAAENHQGNPNAGVAYELDAIAAVVIGGTRLSGGKGRFPEPSSATLIMGVLTNMLRLNNVDSNVEMMIKAVIIVLAVAVQRREECGE